MEELPLSMLTKKLTTLLALLTAQRCQTLPSLDLDFMQEIDNEIIFTIREKLKTTKAGKHLPPIKFLSYPEDIRLCPVEHIKFYIGKTKPMRSQSKLLLSYVKPFKPVTNSTIGRWVKCFLQDSGIDIKHFSAHSSRMASSSYGFLSGLLLNDVLKAGGWTNAGTFAKHYNKPIGSNFGNSLLNHFNNSDNSQE
ncbi:Transposon Tf2-9 poly [Paramuricea clavata]|uniref:Transposon Tf2-9 poly n=1 Tax=Paramuricea clavata TaxID=317549 RepID=A0A7D9EEN1_PARCT|nr:Transposon Tf2-9 poly [Paramuricea clavata]